jgi:YidC/Oxa1 family membrane protein insertase
MDAFLPIWNPSVVEPLSSFLRYLADLTASAGLAIILMTLIIKTLLLPLSYMQTKSMKAMQAIQPEIAALRKKIKDREKLTQETMRLYKERGVNPAAGCLPMVPTMVVLFGLYWALQNLSSSNSEGVCAPPCAPEFQDPFLWVSRLSQPDTLLLIAGLPLPGILPILMAATQYISSKMMAMPSADPQQAMMNRMMVIMMPAMMLFWGVTFPAGLVLYWLISNIFEIGRLYFTLGPGSLSGFSSFSFSSLLGGAQAQDSFSRNGGEAERSYSASPSAAADQSTSSSTNSSGGARSNGRSVRSRRRRGRRSGRR